MGLQDVIYVRSESGFIFQKIGGTVGDLLTFNRLVGILLKPIRLLLLLYALSLARGLNAILRNLRDCLVVRREIKVALLEIRDSLGFGTIENGLLIRADIFKRLRHRPKSLLDRKRVICQAKNALSGL